MSCVVCLVIYCFSVNYFDSLIMIIVQWSPNYVKSPKILVLVLIRIDIYRIDGLALKQQQMSKRLKTVNGKQHTDRQQRHYNNNKFGFEIVSHFDLEEFFFLILYFHFILRNKCVNEIHLEFKYSNGMWVFLGIPAPKNVWKMQRKLTWEQKKGNRFSMQVYGIVFFFVSLEIVYISVVTANQPEVKLLIDWQWKAFWAPFSVQFFVLILTIEGTWRQIPLHDDYDDDDSKWIKFLEKK